VVGCCGHLGREEGRVESQGGRGEDGMGAGSAWRAAGWFGMDRRCAFAWWMMGGAARYARSGSRPEDVSGLRQKN
jgi:hypothetical protein